MQNKALLRNVVPATALTAGTTTSQTERATYAGGIRFYVTVASPTAGGGTDKFFLCGIPPAGGNAVPILGFSGANMLSVAGVYVVDFYPGAWVPGTVAPGSSLLGAAGIHLPSSWAVQIVMGAGNSATIAVDAETLP